MADPTRPTDDIPPLEGHTFNALTVLRFVDRVRAGSVGSHGWIRRWLCRCECGVETLVREPKFLSGSTQSCGCRFRSIRARGSALTHGQSHSPEYRSWISAKARCYNQAQKQFRDYGGRGIAMHDSWKDDFATFLRDVGPRPSPQHTLDRTDNNGDYAPGNVRWATKAEQARNTRQTQRLTLQGRTMCLEDWSKETGIPPQTLSQRLKLGWPAHRILTPAPAPHVRAV